MCGDSVESSKTESIRLYSKSRVRSISEKDSEVPRNRESPRVELQRSRGPTASVPETDTSSKVGQPKAHHRAVGNLDIEESPGAL